MLTWRSAMASSRADCTLAGARLISSASTRLAKTGPSSVSNRSVDGRQTWVPTMSAGIRSGVNCSREKLPPTTSARVRTASVLATPGTPSSRTWPRASRPTSIRSTIWSWPTTTRLTSNRVRSRTAVAPQPAHLVAPSSGQSYAVPGRYLGSTVGSRGAGRRRAVVDHRRVAGLDHVVAGAGRVRDPGPGGQRGRAEQAGQGGPTADRRTVR